jgi:hypothetical protein
MSNVARVSEEAVRALAHKFWEEEGRPEGRAHDHWLRAVAEFDIPVLIPATSAEPKSKKKAKR